jgi:hypothetical protein
MDDYIYYGGGYYGGKWWKGKFIKLKLQFGQIWPNFTNSKILPPYPTRTRISILVYNLK